MTGIESEEIFDVLKSLDAKVFFFAYYLTAEVEKIFFAIVASSIP